MPARESDQSQAVLDFLVSGLPDPPPKALLVTMLANAYKAVAALRQAGEPVDAWLAGERRWSGIRERAAVVAVLNSDSTDTADLVESYRADHPEHAGELAKLLDHLQR